MSEYYLTGTEHSVPSLLYDTREFVKRILLVEFRIKSIEVAAVEFFLYDSEALTETLIVDDFAFP